jgi:hypothetical protein
MAWMDSRHKNWLFQRVGTGETMCRNLTGLSFGMLLQALRMRLEELEDLETV